MIKTSVFLGDDLHREMKLYCVQNDFSIQEFVSKAVAVALASVQEQEPPIPKLTEHQEQKYLLMADNIARSGDPLAVALLRATIDFYSSRLSQQART